MNPTEPANPNEGQPTYVDPITGSPLYIDPTTGQLSYGPAPSTATTPAAPAPFAAAPSSTTPPVAIQGTPPTDPAANPYAAAGSNPYPTPANPYAATPTGYPGYNYPAATPGYSYPLSAYGYGAAQRKTNGLAIGSLVTGIAALPFVFCYGVGGIVLGAVGAILGHVARRQIRDRAEEGNGMALAGIICGWIAVALGIAVLIGFAWLIGHADQFDPNSPDPFNT
jgi:hypothetical protein